MDDVKAKELASTLIVPTESDLKPSGLPVNANSASPKKNEVEKGKGEATFSSLFGPALTSLLKEAGKAAFVALMIYLVYKLLEKRGDIWDSFKKSFPGIAGMLAFLSPKGQSVVTPKFYRDDEKVSYSYDQIREIADEFFMFCEAIDMPPKDVLKVAAIANYLNLDKVRLLGKIVNDGKRVSKARGSDFKVFNAIVH